MSNDEFIQELIEIALKAGSAIADIYRDEFEVRVKADGSQVTKADERAEAIILKGLGRISPEIPVLAEEAASIGNIDEIGSALGSCFYLVDPLDGTREFINKTDEFTVNIALIKNRYPVLGVIYAPILKQLYFAVGGRAYKKSHPQGPVETIKPKLDQPKKHQSLTAITSRLNNNQQTKKILSDFDIKEFQMAGSSLKFCRLAEGAADIYPRLGRTMEWDTAAGQAILEAAGGSVRVHPTGERLSYNKKERGFDNPEFMAFGY